METIAICLPAKELSAMAQRHECWNHPIFEALSTVSLTRSQVAGILRNYDAHAGVLRRLLLYAATRMPEPAVGFILENVRNEYGNGDYAGNHQAQLRDLAAQCGVALDQFMQAKVCAGVSYFCQQVPTYYRPTGSDCQSRWYQPAVIAGAITATEILAMREFQFLHAAFSRLGFGHHIWFHHLTLEQEHSDESLSLANYFIEKHRAVNSVHHGLAGVLDCTTRLYDGFLEALHSN